MRWLKRNQPNLGKLNPKGLGPALGMKTLRSEELSKYSEHHWKSVKVAGRISRVEIILSDFRAADTNEDLDFNFLSRKLGCLINLPCCKIVNDQGHENFDLLGME